MGVAVSVEKWSGGGFRKNWDIGSVGIASHWQNSTIGSVSVKNRCGRGQKIVDGGFPEKRRRAENREKSARGRGQWKKTQVLHRG